MNANVFKFIVITTSILSVLTFVVSSYFDNQQKKNYEKERNEFRLQWEEYNKKQGQEKSLLYLKLVSTCERNPNWDEFKDGYIRGINKSGIDMDSKMFDKMILSDGDYVLERFMHLYFHYDSGERELLRKYKSIHISRLDYNSYPYKLQNFESYKESLPDDLSFIHKKSPGESMGMIIFGGLIIMLVCVIIEAIIGRQTKDEKK